MITFAHIPCIMRGRLPVIFRGTPCCIEHFKGTAFTMPSKIILCHSVYGFVLEQHLRVVLLLNLDIRKEFPHVGILKAEYVGIVL